MATLSSFLRYCTAGAMATLLHYTVLVAGTELAGLHPVSASVAGSACGAAFSYACNRRYTFGSTAGHRQALPRFLSVALLGAAVNALVMVLGTVHFGWNYLVVQMVATVLVLFGSFALNRSWTFA